MNPNFESFLSNHFDDAEIKTLKKRVDYESVKKQIEQNQADDMLDDLTGRVINELKDKKLSLDERFEKIKNNFSVSESLKVSNEKIKSTFDSAENQMNELLGDAKESDIAKKAKTGLQQAKKAAEGAGIGNIFNKIGTFLEGSIFGDLFKWITGLFGKFQNLIGFGEKAEQVTEKIKDAMDPEKREEILSQVNTSIQERFPNHHESINVLIKKQDINDEQIKILEQKIKKNGTLSYEDIKEVIGVDFESLFSKNEIESAKEKGIAQLTDYIGETYGINFNLEPHKRTKTVEIIKDNLTIDTASIIEVKDKKRATLGDGLPLIIESTSNLVGLSSGLILNGVISVTDVAFDFADTYGDNFLLSIDGLPFFETGAMSTFEEKFKNLGEHEKALMFQVIQRKGSFFAKILGNMAYYASNTVVNTIIDTKVHASKFGAQLGMNQFDKQIQSFSILEKSLTGINKNSDALEIAKEQITSLSDNSKKLSIITSAKKASDIYNNPLFSGISQLEDLGKMKTLAAGRINIIGTTSWLDDFKALGYTFGETKELIELQQASKAISEIQQKLASGDINFIQKTRLAFEGADLSRKVDGIVYEGLNKQQASKKLDHLKKLATDSPELLRSTLGASATLGLLGLSWNAHEDKEFLDQLGSTVVEITRLIGPINLCLGVGVDWNNLDNISTFGTFGAGVGAALFTYDSIAIGTIIMKNPNAKGLLNTGKFIIQPITDVAKATSQIINTGRNVTNLGMRGSIEALKQLKTPSIGQVIKSTVSKAKNIKIANIDKRILAATAAGLAIIGTIEYLQMEQSEEMQELVDNDCIDKENGKINIDATKKYLSQFSDEQKNFLSQIILENNLPTNVSDLNFTIEGNQFIAYSNENNDIREYEIFSKNVKEQLHNIFGVEKFSFQNS